MIRFDRLEQLAEHLETGKLGHEKFDFRHYHCGRSGCALGECPYLWPDDWEFIPYGPDAKPVRKGCISVEYSGEEWFEITPGAYRHLFLPWEQIPKAFGGMPIGKTATRYQVAANIRAFIQKMRDEQK